MDKTTKIVLGLVVLGLILVVWAVSSIGGAISSLPGLLNLGASTTTYNTSLAQLGLYNWQVDVVESLSNLRDNVGSLTVTTTSAPSFGVDRYASTTHALAGSALGDSCKVSVSSGTAQLSSEGVQVSCFVGPTAGNFQVQWHVPANGITSTAQVAYDVKVQIGPSTVAGLEVTTSSSPTTPN